jgi:2-oxoisovalerate dehydrogenase E1 component
MSLASTVVDATVQLSIYRTMSRIQACNQAIGQSLSSGESSFTYWPVDGHEAIAAGACAALDSDDQLVITYRGMADAIAKGAPLTALLAEWMGHANGLSRGRAGPMGIFAPEVGLMMSTGIVGAGPSIANGLALAQDLRQTGRVVAVSFGDGATSTGALNEALNLAALWTLPIVFLCQNNLFGEATPIAQYTRTEQLSDRAAAFGMHAETVDGTDPMAVYAAMESARERARSGGGPTFLEAISYRLGGHYFGDPLTTVPKDELAAARAAEPVTKFRSALAASGVATADELAAIDRDEAARVAVAMTGAIAGGQPSVSTLTEHLYGTVTPVDSPSAAAPAVAPDPVPTNMSQAINFALDNALRRDPDVVLIGEDIGAAGGVVGVTSKLFEKYGRDRVRDTPISETAIVGATLGASMAGLRPVGEVMFMDFLTVCLDPLANHAANIRYLSDGRLHAPMTLRMMVGASNGPQHSQSLEAWLMHVPGLKVVWPSTPADAAGLLASCIDDDDPCVFIEQMSLLFDSVSGPPLDADARVPIGKANIVRAGRHLTVLTYGAGIRLASRVAAELAADGVEIEIVDLRTLVPLDMPTILSSCARTRRAVIVHDAVQFCGPGAEIAAALGAQLFGELAAPVARLGASFVPVPQAAALETAARPGPESLRKIIEDTLKW